MSVARSAQLAVLYEYPQWFQPLFAALDGRSTPYVAIKLTGHSFDPASRDVPAPLVLSRVAQERIEEYEEAGLDFLLLQMKPQAEEMDRFAAQVIEPMRTRALELA
jgi:hypothetical protein